VDGTTGVIEIQQGGTLSLNTKPAGLTVSIDGRSAGRTPTTLTVQAGKHQVHVRGSSGRGDVWNVSVEIPPGATVTLSQDFTSRHGGRVSHP
jgi:hypothetical protein